MVEWNQQMEDRQEANEKSVLIHGRPWNVFECGRGEPIVFLHNGGGTLWNWEHQLRRFSSRYRVIAPDLPGFGRSHRPNEPLTLDYYVKGVAALLETLECDRPVLAGNCIGSSIALEFALREPEKVRALALFNVCGGPPMLSSRLQFLSTWRPHTAPGKFLHRSLIRCTEHPFVRRLNATYLYAGREPELPPTLRRFLQAQRRDTGLRSSLSRLISGLDSFSVFSRTREKPANFPPVLLGWGKENRTLDAKWAGVIAEWLCPNQLDMIENAGHMPMYEQPERVNKALDAFLLSAAGE